MRFCPLIFDLSLTVPEPQGHRFSATRADPPLFFSVCPLSPLYIYRETHVHAHPLRVRTHAHTRHRFLQGREGLRDKTSRIGSGKGFASFSAFSFSGTSPLKFRDKHRKTLSLTQNPTIP
jgi:hypothetical protein